MSDERNADKVLVCALAVAVAIVFILAGYAGGHMDGYRHGVTISQLFYEEWGRFPTEDEAMDWEDRHWPIIAPVPTSPVPYKGRP